MIVCALMACLCACSSKPRATICGVPVHGTPLQLAASIEADGDGTFLIDDVHILFGKALICGWRIQDDPNTEYPDTILCDLVRGQVVHAVWASESR